MAQALAFAFTAMGATAAAGALVTTAGGLTMLGAAVNIGASLLFNSMTSKRPSGPRPESIQTNSKTTVGARVKHYGLVKVGGAVVFHRAKDQFDYRIVVHGHGQVSKVLKHYLNNEEVELNADGFVTDSDYHHDRPRVQIFGRKGIIPETHYSELTGVFPVWTDKHRLDGLCSSLIICEGVPPEKYNGMYPQGQPKIEVLAETTKVYDPRTGQTEYSDNAALIIADYISSPDGMNQPNAIDEANLIEQANTCDEEMALANGGSEKRYRISGSYALDEQPKDVLARMSLACAGRLRLRPNGKVSILVGKWQEPEFILGFHHIVNLQNFSNGPDLLDRYNELPAQFTSHALGHILVDAEPWRDDARIENDDQVLVSKSRADLTMCPSHRQCRAVQKIMTERENPKEEITLECKPSALPAIYEDVIKMDIPEMDIKGDYEVVHYSVNLENGLMQGVTLTLRKVDKNAFTLALNEQGKVQSLPPKSDGSGVPEPQGVTAVSAGIKGAQNTFLAGIRISWQSPPSDTLSPKVKIRKSGESEWDTVTVDGSATTVAVNNLIDSQSYDVSVAFQLPKGNSGDGVTITGVIAKAVSDPPSAPTGLTVDDTGNGAALLRFTSSSSDSIWKTEIYRDGNLLSSLNTAPSAQIVYNDDCGAGSFQWSVRSMNVSGDHSASDAGPVSAAIAEQS